ncbi:hypothetical protein [Lactobacillus delbrueckii]|uniref:hypothetical protein n=1 Tax=Lactobacillus delbrueckii TaxID=1584 RepID=UPI001E3DC782|nr:hypothetical protein [Lactobacillus delbrueckii]
MAGKEAVLILLASCWEGQVLARLFLPEDLAGIEPEAVYPAAAEVVLALPGLPVCDPLDLLAAISLILLFAAAAGMTLYQRRYLGGIKDSIWVFAVFALLRLLATLLFTCFSF